MYEIENPIGKAMNGMGQAAGTYGNMMKNIPANRDPGPSVGGAINAGMGGVGAAATVGSLMAAPGAVGMAAIGGPITLGIGAALGIGSYLLS